MHTNPHPARIAPRFLASNALSLLGNSIAAVALPLILLATTGDALAAGTLALICAVPQMVIGVVGGAALDRFNRRDISILSDLVSAASVALIPVVDMLWGLNFGWFVALSLLGAVGDIPGMTARDALLPAVVARDKADLQRFMGLTQSLDSLDVYKRQSPPPWQPPRRGAPPRSRAPHRRRTDRRACPCRRSGRRARGPTTRARSRPG